MSHALAGQGAEKCRKHYLQVERKGSMVEIILVKGDFYRDRQVVPAVYLRPAGDARHEQMNALASSQFDEVVLVEKRRPRPDKSHVPLQDAEQLRQFVQAVSPKDPADSCQVLIGGCQQVRGHRRCFNLHGPELRHPEEDIVPTDPDRPIQDGAGG